MPKIIGGSLEQHREQTRQRVFDALTRLLADRRFDTITMADLAAEAGIGRTAIYNHFADKDAVVVAFASDETDRYLERLRAALDASDDPVERLRAYVRQHLALSEEFHFGLGPELYGMLSGEAMSQIREHVVAVEAVLRELIEQGRDTGRLTLPGDDVDAAIALVHTALQTRRVGPGAVEEFVVSGLGAR